MTYCVGLLLDDGLVLASDSRTNAGVDDIRRTSKMHVYAKDGDRVLVALSAGNLSLTQNVLNLLEHRARFESDRPGIHSARSLFEVAGLVGDAMREIRARNEEHLRDTGIDATGSFIVGGQIASEAPRLFLVYSEGNFIEASPETPYFQTGEIKFGKPILDRVVTPRTPLAEACKSVIVSFDSTMRSNLSVGLPIDLLAYRRDSLRADLRHRLEEGDPYYETIHARWNEAMREAIHALPEPDWLID